MIKMDLSIKRNIKTYYYKENTKNNKTFKLAVYY